METNTTLSGFETIVDDNFSKNGIVYTESSASLTDAEIDAIYNRAKTTVSAKDTIVRDAFGNEIVQEEGEGTDFKGLVDAEDGKVAGQVDTIAAEIAPEETVEEGSEADGSEEDGESSEYEATIVSGLFDAFREEIGIELGENEEAPKTIEDFVGKLRDIVAENSVPEYASEESKRFDDFIRQGGDPSKYLQATVDANYDNFDISTEANQKRIVTDFLREKGFNDDYIARKLDRYEATDSLEAEAEEALEMMKGIGAAKKEALLAEQNKAYAAQVQQQQEFVSNVVNYVKELKDIRGVAIPESEKKATLDYIFKADANGVTPFQRDYSKDAVRNLVESAYFLRKGDTLLSTAKQMGNNSALKSLKQSLKTSGAGKGTKRIQTSTSNSIFSRAIQQYF